MSKKFLTSIDLHKNELQNAVVHSLVTAPASGTAGQIYYNSTDKKLYQHDGTSWVCVGIAYALGTGTPSSNTVPITLSANGQVQDTITIAGAGGATLSFSNGTLTITTADNNTTYTFTGAASSTAYVITCTPSSGTAQTVTIPLADGTNAGLMSPSEYTKLSGIESGAQKNVQGDFNQSDSSADDFIKNKPTIINYDTGTASDLSTGTSTTAKVWTPKVIHDHVAGASPVQTNENTTPYQFRPTPQCGSIEYLDQVVGGTLAVNQLVNTRIDFSNTVTDTRTTLDFYLRGYSSGLVYNKSINTAGVLSTVFASPRDTSGIEMHHNGSQNNVQIYASQGGGFINGHKYFFTINFTSVNPSIAGGLKAKDAQITDLTQLFCGSATADYVYNLEQSTAGSGVAWLKQYYPSIFNSYQPYNAGELMSVEASEHVMTGKNQFDKTDTSKFISNAYINASGSTGVIITGNGRGTVFIPCVPNTKYVISKTRSLSNDRFYVGYTDKFPEIGDTVSGMVNADSSGTIGTKSEMTLTTGANAMYLVVWAYWSNATVDLDTLQIEFGSTATTYEPYTSTSYPLDSDLVLRGIPKLNNGVPYYDGDTYESDGTVTRKYGIVDLGSLSWTLNITEYDFPYFYASILDRKAGAQTFVCSKYATVSGARGSLVDKSITYYATASDYRVVVRDSAYSTTADFKTAMSGVYLIYELATPTTETADPFTNPQVCYKGGTEEFVSSNVVPVGHTTYYPLTLKDTMPTSNGTYTLSLTVADGKPTLSWS